MYLALYRKFRPKTFDEVIGQNHITTTLKNQIINGQIAHAYLFCGSRGTGKTSVAKVFAQSLNCENPQQGSACGKCATCKALEQSNNMDILEIDAASNNRVDEIRDLREHVKYPPVNAKYKVYIIDEVHMLTDSAFNALLKTLEEPPSYVVFILATTEVQKLPATILSRCLRFDFKLVSNEVLEKHLEKVFTAMGVTYEKEAIALLASLGEGSVRDMLSVADTAMAYANKRVTYQSVLESVGAIDKKSLFLLGESIVEKQSGTVIETIDALVSSGKNVSQISKDLANYFRDLAVIKTAPNYETVLSYPKELLQKLIRVANGHDIETILACLKAFSSLENDFRNTSNPRLLLEATALTMMQNTLQDLAKRVEKLEVGEKKLPTKTLNIGQNSPSIVKVVELFDDEVHSSTTASEPIKQDQTSLSVFSQMETVQKPLDDAQSVFGKMLILLREKQELMLHSLLGDGVQCCLNANRFVLSVSDEVKFKTLNKNLELLSSLLAQLQPNWVLSVELNAVKPVEKTEKKLAELFGNILTVE